MPDFDEFYESAFSELATAVLAAVEREDAAAACETVLAAEDFHQTVERLPSLPVDVRRRLAHACVRLYKAADTRERRDRILTVHAWLLGRRESGRGLAGHGASTRRAVTVRGLPTGVQPTDH